MKLPMAGRRVPAAGCEHLDALVLGRLVPGGGVEGKDGHLPHCHGPRGGGQHVVGRGAVHRVRAGPLLLHDVAVADRVEEGERGAVHPVVGINGVHGLQEVADMADMALRVEQQLQHFPHQHLQLGLNK